MSTDASAYSQAQIEEMRAGARNAVNNCMVVMPDDRVFVLSDEATHPIGRVLTEAVQGAGAQVVLRHLEDFGPRPFVAIPPALRADVLRFRPTVTFYAASIQPGELPFRIALRQLLLDDLHARHAHMPGITYRLMMEGMRTDYRTIAAITDRVCELVRPAQTIHVTTPDGTDLIGTFDPTLRWIASTGVYAQAGQWGNLPDGEVFTCPGNVEGNMVAHLLGDHFSSKYGVLPHPVSIEIHQGRVSAVTCPDRSVADDLLAYLDSAPNGRRVGEFAIGTNIGLKALTGNLLQDEKLPGLHIAFGDPYADETGASWHSTVHVDVIAVHCTILLDGRTLMRDGQFDYGLLGLPATGS
jgi:aminopeptidase